MSAFDDYRLAPILDDSGLFDSASIDLFPLDLPPLQDASGTRPSGLETTSAHPTTPTRASFDTIYPEASRSSETRRPKPGAKNTAPLAEVLNHDDERGEREQTGQDWTTSPAKRRRIDNDRREERQERIQLPELLLPDRGPQPPSLPPLLQGLHEPPPDARLFPPIDRNGDRCMRPVGESRSDRNVHERDYAMFGSTDLLRELAIRNIEWSNEQGVDFTQDRPTDLFRDNASRRADFEHHQSFKPGTAADRSRPQAKSANLPARRKENIPGRADKTRKSMHFSNILRSNTPVWKSTEPTPPGRDKSGKSSKLAKGSERKKTRETAQKAMKTFTSEEDAAILDGFNKWGQKWSWIQAGSERIASRSPGDIRDRFRLKWPAKYAALGLKGGGGTGGRRRGRQGSRRDQSSSAPGPFEGFVDPADVWKRPAA